MTLTMVDTLLTVVEILGVTSVIGMILLWVTFVGFLPEIMIEGVTDQSRLFNSESKLKIRNSGKIAAHNVRADVYELNMIFNTNTFRDCTFINCGPPIATKLAGGEQTESTIRPGIGIGKGDHFDQFSYILEIKYDAKLLFLKKSFAKRWNIELKNYPDGYSWVVTVA